MRTLLAALLAALCAACGGPEDRDEPAARIEPLYLTEVLGPVTSARRPHGSLIALEAQRIQRGLSAGELQLDRVRCCAILGDEACASVTSERSDPVADLLLGDTAATLFMRLFRAMTPLSARDRQVLRMAVLADMPDLWATASDDPRPSEALELAGRCAEREAGWQECAAASDRVQAAIEELVAAPGPPGGADRTVRAVHAARAIAVLCDELASLGDIPEPRAEPPRLDLHLRTFESAVIAWTFTSKPTWRSEDGDPIGRRVADRLARRWLDRR